VDTGEGDFAPPEELAARADYEATSIGLSGLVLSEDGTPVAGAGVTLGDVTASTDASGRFELRGLSRANRLLTITYEGLHDHHQAVVLRVPSSVESVSLEPIVMASRAATRFVFAGDLTFARRFLDPLDTTPRNGVPPSRPDALIDAADPEPGSRGVVAWIRPLYQSADFAALNFESAVTLAPDTPHPTKDFVYFTFPGSLPALDWLGVDYVSVGNNHVFDYLEPGLADTLAYLDDAALPHSGAGPNLDSALRPYRVTTRGVGYSHFSATSVAGARWEITYVATDSKGGAADLRDSERVSATLRAEAEAGFVPIAHLHMGDEYTFAPSDYALGRAALAVDAGAALVVGHHPHVAQGFGLEEGVLVLHSLGNLSFDQDRIETMMSLVAQVDLEGATLRGAWGVPLYLEDYRPRLVGGALADVLLRRLAEVSRGHGAHLVYSYGGRLWLARSPDEVVSSERTVEVEVPIDARGWGVVDLRGTLREGESLAAVDPGGAALELRPGRDLLLHGDFEDYDVDEDAFETARWYREASAGSCRSVSYRGVAALCSYRTAVDGADSVITLRNRVRAFDEAIGRPKKDLSLVGYVRGDGAGPLSVVARFFASVDDAEFGEAEVFTHDGGDFAWLPIAVDLPIPPDVEGDPLDPTIHPRAVRLFLRHGAPREGRGRVAWDELAIVGWEETLPVGVPSTLEAPHARDFLRVGGAPGLHRLTLTLRRHRPAMVP
jgi:hypothetical protein